MSVIRTVDDDSLAQAAAVIQAGGVVGIPTDTVYGVACDPFSRSAVDRIYQAKRRPRHKALQVLLPSVDALDALGLTLPVPLDRLAAMFMPGAFSPIAVAREGCALATVRRAASGVPTQGVRIPADATSLRILRVLGPVAASSANRSGAQSAQSAQEAAEQLGDDVDLYLDAGPTPGHVSSTVVAANPSERDGIEILREGVIPESTIRAALHGSVMRGADVSGTSPKGNAA